MFKRKKNFVYPQHKHSFTLIELLVVVAIIALLSSLLLPALVGAREMGRRIKCVSNLKNMGLAAQMYADDWDGWLPNQFVSGSENWVTSIAESLGATRYSNGRIWHHGDTGDGTWVV
ncbi:DUF1559 domain-containing protein [bacterium]|nr:DUF1559 domain-containing protein [bacterium]